jgi:hypothetical protein
MINNFDASNIVFSAVKKNRNGGKFVTLSSASGNMYIQLPPLRAPFGVNPPNDQVKDYYLNLSLTPDLEDKFRGIDERVLDYVHENSVALLNKQVDRNVMRDLLYTPVVRASKDPKYAPTIKFKASTGEGKNLSDVYNSNREKVTLDDISKGSNVETIIELSQIYFINGKFGVSMRLNQAKISQSNKLSGYAFVDTPHEEEIDVPEDA